jgi:hypothetical protein
VCLLPIYLAAAQEAPRRAPCSVRAGSAPLDYQRVVDRLLDEAANEQAPTSLEGGMSD